MRLRNLDEGTIFEAQDDGATAEERLLLFG